MEITLCCGSRSFYLIDNLKICTNNDCLNYLGFTQTENQKKDQKYLYSFFFAILLMFPIHYTESYSRVSPIKLNINTPVKIHIPEPTTENVLIEIRKSKILCSEHVLAQIKLESANMSSFLFKRTNNFLGMRYPYRRSTSAIGIYLPEEDSIVYGDQKELLKYRSRLTYAVYANWLEAVEDYKLWQDQTFNVEKRYLEFLRKNYAEDPLYIDKVSYIANSLK